MAKVRILVVNGPNLNLLGIREPDIYGNSSLADIQERVMAYLSNSLTESDRDVPEVVFFQSNSESDIVEILQKAATTDSQDSHSIDGIVLNCAAYTHTSVAIRDALLLCRQLPSVEVHLSNVHAREEFRKQSLLSDVVDAVICGLGWRGYLAACQWIDEQIALKG